MMERMFETANQTIEESWSNKVKQDCNKVFVNDVWSAFGSVMEFGSCIFPYHGANRPFQIQEFHTPN